MYYGKIKIFIPCTKNSNIVNRHKRDSQGNLNFLPISTWGMPWVWNYFLF